MEIKFKNRAVAFIDVLGFKSVVEGAAKNSNEDLEELQSLVNFLKEPIELKDKSGNIQIVNDEQLLPTHLSISDSIILSTPLHLPHGHSERRWYCGLSILVMRVIQITLILLDKGYLIRGGISVGKVCHNSENIVGPAYQEAYQIETNTEHPRIELSDSAKRFWRRENDPDNSMCIFHDNRYIVNGLHAYYFDKNYISLQYPGRYTSPEYIPDEHILNHYSNEVSKKIDNLMHCKKAQRKWQWFNEFIEFRKNWHN